MDRFDRIYALHTILSNSKYPVSRKIIQEKIECSRATFARIAEDLRDFLGAPIKYSRKYNGYYYAGLEEGQKYELPGLWFNSSEIYALLTCHELLKNAQPGLLDEHIAPLQKRINEILTIGHHKKSEIGKKIRILKMAFRKVSDEIFQKVASATVEGKQLQITYHGRTRDEDTNRTISPLRLVLYRDNWYLDAYCHLRNALRVFSVDKILKAEQLPKKVKKVSETRLNKHFAESYGIFSGKPKHTAVLRFNKEISNWVSNEQWHPKQEGKFVDSGEYELKVPYSDHLELSMDILKYGSNVEVISPSLLKVHIIKTLEKSLTNYKK